MRLEPSKVNGLVTTATVRMPSERATSAITGPAPVPVPPPMPAVMNTMCEPASASSRRSRSASATARASSGLAPAPSPLVPSWIWLRALLRGEHLRVGVDGDELHAFDALLDHVIDGVAACAADADHLDHGPCCLLIDDFEHVFSPCRLSTTLHQKFLWNHSRIRPNTAVTEPLCLRDSCPCCTCEAPSSSRPIAVA